jgi:hypothetical protein
MTKPLSENTCHFMMSGFIWNVAEAHTIGFC